MKGKIVRYGMDNRDHLVSFLANFYKKHAPDAVQDEHMSSTVLNKNWSCFLYERDRKNFLCFFDGDDGAGGTPFDIKLNWPRFQNLLNHYNVVDYMVFKIQHSPWPEARQFYPFKRDVYPLALMTNDPPRVFKLADEMKPKEQDIDVLFVGGRVHDHNGPYCWPKHRNTNQHWPTSRKIGYGKLLEIKERRKDLNIVAVDNLLQHGDYYDLVNRTKVCLDFPGIGVSSRKFYEFLVLGKCVLALQQNNCCWPLEHEIHYWSMGMDFEYKNLEAHIDFLLSPTGAKIRKAIGRSAAALRPLMSFDAVGDYVERTFEQFVDWNLDGTIELHRTEFE